MNREHNIARFEAEMSKVQRLGVDRLLEYIRKSDFYTAPASTKYHLSCEGGLLQHSLNVLDALRGILTWNPDANAWDYQVAGKTADSIPEESVVIMALLHDICKTYFYGTSTRNVKNDRTGKWEKVPYYTVNDRMPLGHGPKSAMLIKEYIPLTNKEMYAIWHHMGFTGDRENDGNVGASIEKYPILLALQTADWMASRIMEAEGGNKDGFTFQDLADETGEGTMDEHLAAEEAEGQAQDNADWQEAPPLQEGA